MSTTVYIALMIIRHVFHRQKHAFGKSKQNIDALKQETYPNPTQVRISTTRDQGFEQDNANLFFTLSFTSIF